MPGMFCQTSSLKADRPSSKMKPVEPFQDHAKQRVLQARRNLDISDLVESFASAAGELVYTRKHQAWVNRSFFLDEPCGAKYTNTFRHRGSGESLSQFMPRKFFPSIAWDSTARFKVCLAACLRLHGSGVETSSAANSFPSQGTPQFPTRANRNRPYSCDDMQLICHQRTSSISSVAGPTSRHHHLLHQQHPKRSTPPVPKRATHCTTISQLACPLAGLSGHLLYMDVHASCHSLAQANAILMSPKHGRSFQCTLLGDHQSGKGICAVIIAYYSNHRAVQ